MDILCGVVGGTSLYALYVQYSPKIGNIWLRPDSNGDRVFVLSNLCNMMKEPLHSITFWKLSNLDLNVFCWCVGTIGLIKGVNLII